MPALEARKYSHTTKYVSATRTRMPWRDREKRVQNARTSAEREAALTARRSKQDSIKTMLEEGLDVIDKLAHELSERDGTHDADWWYMKLTQHTRKKKSRRKPSTWNAFLHQLRKNWKEGKLI